MKYTVLKIAVGACLLNLSLKEHSTMESSLVKDDSKSEGTDGFILSLNQAFACYETECDDQYDGGIPEYEYYTVNGTRLEHLELADPYDLWERLNSGGNYDYSNIEDWHETQSPNNASGESCREWSRGHYVSCLDIANYNNSVMDEFCHNYYSDNEYDTILCMTEYNELYDMERSDCQIEFDDDMEKCARWFPE